MPDGLTALVGLHDLQGSICAFTGLALETLGYQVTRIQGTTPQAIRAAFLETCRTQGPFDLYFLDANLGHVAGDDVSAVPEAKRILEEQGLVVIHRQTTPPTDPARRVRFIATSAYPDVVAKAEQYGVDGLQKPYTPSQIRQLLSQQT